MAYDDDSRSLPRDRGFSIVELLIVVAIIGVMAGVGYPAIAQYMRNYKIRTATRDVAGGLQSCRSKAIMSNTSAGVSFVVVDADSYRYVMEDLAQEALDAVPPDTRHLSPLMDLPEGVVFVERGRAPSARFWKLGTFCYPAATAISAALCTAPTAGTGSPVYTTCVPADGAQRCSAGVNGLGAYYVDDDLDAVDNGVAGGVMIQVRDTKTNLIGRVHLAPGGRVSSDYRQARP